MHLYGGGESTLFYGKSVKAWAVVRQVTGIHGHCLSKTIWHMDISIKANYYVTAESNHVLVRWTQEIALISTTTQRQLKINESNDIERELCNGTSPSTLMGGGCGTRKIHVFLSRGNTFIYWVEILNVIPVLKPIVLSGTNTTALTGYPGAIHRQHSQRERANFIWDAARHSCAIEVEIGQ